MQNDIVSVTDHIKDYIVERDILGEYFSDQLTSQTTIALVWHEVINQDFLSKYPSIRAIVRYGVGFDNIDLEICRKRKIIVVNTPDYGIDEVSDTALAMILCLTRKINSFQEFAKEDEYSWSGKDIPFPVKRIRDMSLGIIGLGRIGGCLARKFTALSNNVGFHDPYLPSGVEKVLGLKRFQSLQDLLRNSDIVSIHTPLNHESKGLVNEDFISNMKDGSYLINVSRGAIVKDKSIIYDALVSHKLEGYGTDVWTQEPPTDKDQLYINWKKENAYAGRIIINPHTAYYSHESLEEARTKACKNCLNIIKGRNIINRIV
ncbi:NAD(P)-dependent oxidoreductase [Prochlorococcus marinus]|uniref:Lactate dehydrogenase and related dehydrogenase n=1 Tax=Prochlorococcus marinus (strain MIT 9211) TaxID=93059 RepID=A9BBK8_PROM4|nr:NAD(P)-dependent oxidoreductase [Prochlorococcus marinus]ABX09220.1 Lactate dehydrogenase and related dehydrogenase [Prochlorococcus marinus str. MIT 9211]